ncbi:MAG TPA: CBS domain-containing protein [Candidatus Moranbacteria bacterium]|jgi:CBS domain-containing protein|nr:CBS domain-containing protein [Candidatus Moranbacteria bacterium]HOF42676.1 CBS domain-containing protein [Candidatus Moranbacteria bacterium]HPX94519.1 CBS domain-containing protein [Candidatus Moranbacteria bacterium]HQB59957.1 CBS domain-containing protein [Candidatus Moranbacteria bacterium]
MLVRDIMTKNVVTVSPETKVVDVAEILFKNKFHGVPVVRDNEVVGIITATDFFTKGTESFFLPTYIKFLGKNVNMEKLNDFQREKVKKLLDAKVEDIMSRNCVTVMADMRVEDVMEFFKTTKFSTFPVTDEKNLLIGIVTLADILGSIKI